AWCITNISSGGHDETSTVVACTNVLVNYLSSNNKTLQDQCAWALGNIALDCKEYRDIIISQGVIRPLLKMLSTSTVNNILTTVCFTLSSLFSYPVPNTVKKFPINEKDIFQFMFDINDHCKRLKESINSNDNNSNISSISQHSIVLDHILWTFYDILLYIPESILVSLKDNQLFITLTLLVCDLSDIINSNNSNIELNFTLPLIRIFGLIVQQQDILLHIVKELFNSNQCLAFIKSIFSLLNTSNSSNNSNTIGSTSIIKESFYFLSNLTCVLGRDQFRFVDKLLNEPVILILDYLISNQSFQNDLFNVFDLFTLYEFLILFSNSLAFSTLSTISTTTSTNYSKESVDIMALLYLDLLKAQYQDKDTDTDIDFDQDIDLQNLCLNFLSFYSNMFGIKNNDSVYQKCKEIKQMLSENKNTQLITFLEKVSL
ncbi:hypothetical protein CYY_010078, partial [Polysphondylium violaceum]